MPIKLPALPTASREHNNQQILMPIKLPSLRTTSREHKRPTNSDAH